MWISQAWAQAAGGTPAGGDMLGTLGSLAPMLLIFVVFYFLLIRPQQRKAKQHRALVQALKTGDQVLTSGGLLGVVTQVTNDSEVKVEIADGVRVRVLRQAITEVINKTAEAAKK
jgi:preprotein translocase subunit YajC